MDSYLIHLAISSGKHSSIFISTFQHSLSTFWHSTSPTNLLKLMLIVGLTLRLSHHESQSRFPLRTIRSLANSVCNELFSQLEFSVRLQTVCLLSPICLPFVSSDSNKCKGISTSYFKWRQIKTYSNHWRQIKYSSMTIMTSFYFDVRSKQKKYI